MSENMVLLSMVRKLRQRSAEDLAKKYQTFDSVEQMDCCIQSFVERWGLQLSESTIIVLEYLVRHSLKIIGVSWLTVRSIAKLANLSERSVQRILNILEDLRIIKRIPTNQSSGAQGVNLIVIQQVENQQEQPPNAGHVTGVVREKVVGDSAPKSINLLNLSESIDIDYYSRVNAKLSNSRFVESKLYTYAINKLHNGKLPQNVQREIYYHMIHELDASDFVLDAPVDLHQAVNAAASKFNTFYRKGHRISSFGSFYVAIFKDQLRRLRELRFSSMVSTG